MENFREFCNYVEDHFLSYLPEEFENGTVEMIQKECVNGGTLDGITVRSESGKPVPCVYLNSAYESYRDGKSADEICRDLASTFVEADRNPVSVDLNHLRDFEKVKGQIEYHLISRKNNSRLLQTRPHKDISDLAAIYSICVSETENGTASIPISNDQLRMWGVTGTDLHNIAMENAAVKETYELKDIESLLLSFDSDNLLEGGEPEWGQPLLVLSNASKMYGAKVLANNEVLSRVAEVVKDDYYILPSSLHEVLIMPKTLADETGITPKELGQMVRDINAAEVKKEERLSDHIYDFNRETKELGIVKSSREVSRDMER